MNDKLRALMPLVALAAAAAKTDVSDYVFGGRPHERGVPLKGGFCKGCGGRIRPREGEAPENACKCSKGDF